MICKEDVVCWFKELESYERIDTMCTLLNMCLPFELRFLGTCLEELGRRDSQELRGIELRVNNPQELASDISSCRSGEPTDMKIRRKMALYLALIRVCNRSSVTENIFQTLEGWGDRDFYKFGDGDPLQELLLVYTMAANHPVFSFEQRMKCGEIYNKISECNKLLDSPRQQEQHNFMQPTVQQQSPQPMSLQNLPNSMSSPPPPSHPQLNQQPITVHQLSGMVLSQGTIPVGFSHNAMTQMIPPESNLPSSMTVDNITQMIPHALSMNHDFTLTGPWAVRHGMMHASYPPPSLERLKLQAISMPLPRSSSPMSQPSSPVPSRTSSPTRNNSLQQTIQHTTRNNPHQRTSPNVMQRTSRRPSDDKTPPPQQQQQSQLQQQHLIANSNDSSIQHNTKNYDEMVLNVDGAISQLKSIYQNGYIRQNHHTIPRHSNKSSYLHHQHHHNLQQHQQQQQQHASNYNQNFALQKVNVDTNMENHVSVDGVRQKSIESDSGGSSVESVDSPPNTPLITANIIRQNIKEQRGKSSRQNGRSDKFSNTQYMFVPSHQQAYTMTGSTTSSVVTNNIIATTPGIISTQHNISSPTSACVNSVVTSNPQILLQQFPAQHLQPSPLTATYPYPIQHRSALISHSQTQPPLTHQHTFRHPTFQMQPNGGELLYPYPPSQTTIAFLPTAPTQQPQTVRSSPSIQPTQLQQLPVESTPQSSVAAIAYPTQNKMILSCFNCGSQMHAGRDCHEASMEDVTRGSIYKLDYELMTSLSEQNATIMTGSSALTDAPIIDGGTSITSSTTPTTSATPIGTASSIK